VVIDAAGCSVLPRKDQDERILTCPLLAVGNVVSAEHATDWTETVLHNPVIQRPQPKSLGPRRETSFT